MSSLPIGSCSGIAPVEDGSTVEDDGEAPESSSPPHDTSAAAINAAGSATLVRMVRR